MKLAAYLLVGLSLSACTAQEQYRTGVVGADGRIVWDEPASTGPTVEETLGNAFKTAGDYYGGRAAGYQQYQPAPITQHGTMNTLINGQPGFINY